MLKIKIAVLFLLIGFPVFAATPNAGYFAGGGLVTRTFTIEKKSNKNSVDYNDRVLAFHGGFRGNFTQVFFEYQLDNTFSSKAVDTDLSSYAVRFDYFKSFDLLYAQIGAKLDYLRGSSDYGRIPEGVTPGLHTSLGAFLGNKFSVEWEFTYSLPVSNSEVELTDIRYFGLHVSYHF